MTLFLSTPTRRYEISDAYGTCLLSLVFGSENCQVVERQKQRAKEKQNINDIVAVR